MEDPAPAIPLEKLVSHREWVRRVARALVRDEALADDLEQEVWLEALRSPPRSGRSFGGWLAAAMRHNLVDLRRSESRRRVREAAAARPEAGKSAVELVAEAEEHRRVVAAVLELEEPYRGALLLRYFEDLPPGEVARRQGVPLETARSRLKRAVSLLRERFDSESHGDRATWCLALVPLVRDSGASGTAGSLSGAVAGGVLMASATKVVAATVVIVAAATGGWWLSGLGTKDAPVVGTVLGESPAPSHMAAVPMPPAPAAQALPEEAEPRSPSPQGAGLVVTGRVVDAESGEPIAGAEVRLGHRYARIPDRERMNRTSPDGSFRFEGVEDRSFADIVASAPGYPEQAWRKPWSDPGRGRNPGEAGDLRLHPGKRVAGRVVAVDGTSPVPGASLFLCEGGGSGAFWTNHAQRAGQAAEDGSFLLEKIPPSPYAPHMPWSLIALSERGVGWVTLPASAGMDDADGVTVRLRPTGSALVSVRNEAGRPIEGVQVAASPRFEPLGPDARWGTNHDAWIDPDSAFGRVLSVPTDTSGVARFPWLPVGEDGARYDFVARSKEGALAWKDGLAVPGGREVVVDLVMPESRPWSVSGVVRTTDGAPVAGAGVGNTWNVPPTTTDREGRFRIEGLRVEWSFFTFEVTSQGMAKAVVRVEAPRTGAEAEVEVVVHAACVVAGRLEDTDGKPGPGAPVQFYRSTGNAGGSMLIAADAEGRFSWPDATEGEWETVVMPPEPWDAWQVVGGNRIVHAGDGEVRFVLRRVEQSSFRVVAEVFDLETGNPLSPQEAMVVDGERQFQFGSQLNPYGELKCGAGKVEIERTKPGRWGLLVRVADRPAALGMFEVGEGGPQEVRLRIGVGRNGTIRGRVEGEGPFGKDGIRMVEFLSGEGIPEPEWARYRTSDAIGCAWIQGDGTFVAEGVRPGLHRLRVNALGWIGEAAVEVPSGQEVPATIRLVRSAKVIFVLAERPPGGSVRIWTSRDGEVWDIAVARSGLKEGASKEPIAAAPGRLLWRARFPLSGGGAGPEGEVTLEGGQTVEVGIPVR